jgi:hypothetical protein
MIVWVDGDACPRGVREIVAKRCRREGIRAIFVADRDVSLSDYPDVEMRIVSAGAEATDKEILDSIQSGDVAVTRDILLAEALLSKGAEVINDRGERFDPESISERRSLRDFSYDLRSSGLAEAGARRYGRKEIERFANGFDRLLVRLLKKE